MVAYSRKKKQKKSRRKKKKRKEKKSGRVVNIKLEKVQPNNCEIEIKMEAMKYTYK